MDQRRVSAFSAASHRGTSSGIPTTILSLLPITSDPRSHLGAQASGPRQTPAPMRRYVIPPQKSHLRARASGPRQTPAPMRRCVIPPQSHLGAQASGPRQTPAPMRRCVIPPQSHLGARASGPQVWWTTSTHRGAHQRLIIPRSPAPPQAGGWRATGPHPRGEQGTRDSVPWTR